MKPNVEGAWTRRWVRIDGSPRFETQHVVWLQAGAAYADVRIPFHPAADTRCFTGTSGWDGDRYRWTHHLDLEGSDSPAGDDVGDLEWQGEVLLERGLCATATGSVPYEEAWVRLAGDAGITAAATGDDRTDVRVGDHRLTVLDARMAGGTFTATYQRAGATVLAVERA